MTSTHDLVSRIPSYMVGVISSHLLGDVSDVDTLAEGLSDSNRLKAMIDSLSSAQKDLLIDLYELGGQVDWQVLARIFADKIDALREDLTILGQMGLVFQGGLSHRDPVFILPSLVYLLEELKQGYHYRDKSSLSWDEPVYAGIWGHIAMINAVRSTKIRCRSGLEPFKKGWQLLEDRLSQAVPEYRRVFWELAELGCIGERNGFAVVNQDASMGLAMDGDARYGIWRFLQACRPHTGLDFKVYSTVFDRAVSRISLERSMYMYLIGINENLEDVHSVVQDLIGLWISCGILQEDLSGGYIRFPDSVFSAFKTGNAQAQPNVCSDEVIIQPNMEILVPKDFDSVDHFNIGEISEIIKPDVVSIYRITKTSVFNALRIGWDAKKIEQFLNRISKHAVPENVVKTIELWCISHEEAYIIKGTFLVCKGDKQKCPQGLEEVLPGIFRIPDKCVDDVSSFLDRKGVMIRNMEGDTSDEEPEIDWGKPPPLARIGRSPLKISRKSGVYPFGMVTPLPYGSKGEILFEQAMHDGRTLIIFYPRQGYGEIEVKKISPVYMYRKGGTPFVEAFCEDTGEGEVFDISKVRALLLNENA